MFHLLSRTIFPTSPKPIPWPWPWPCLSPRPISTSSSSSSKDNSFTVSYLIGTLGLSPERAFSISKTIRFQTGAKPDTVIAFLKNQGLSQTTALKAMRTSPSLLVCNPEKSLKPKIDFFKKLGFSASDICSIIAGCSPILTRSLKNEIVPCFDFFSTMFQSKQKFMRTVVRHSGILCDRSNRLEPNVNLLRDEGVLESHIVRFIEYQPRALKRSPKRFKEIVQEVKELGFDPSRVQFVIALQVKIGISKSTWARKEGLFRKWGWTDYDISAAFRVHPYSMATSDDKIEAIMDFLVNGLGYKSYDISRCPSVLSMSLRKRIVPRGSVVLALRSKGLISKLSLSSIFKWNEKDFLDKFVSCHEKEADELLKLYQSKLA